jgi:hypothetical protein
MLGHGRCVPFRNGLAADTTSAVRRAVAPTNPTNDRDTLHALSACVTKRPRASPAETPREMARAMTWTEEPTAAASPDT